MKISVASCLPALSQVSSDKQHRAAALMRACQLTAQHALPRSIWQQGWAPVITAAPKAKFELSEADIKTFADLLLAPDTSSGKVKVILPSAESHSWSPSCQDCQAT